MVDIVKQPLLVTQAQDAVAEARDGSTQNPVRYSRKSYKHWTDEDFDTANTREEVLLDAAQGDVRVTKNKYSGQNKVTGGEWITPYSGDTVRHRGGIEIDHAVPLYWADQHGANEWTPEQKQLFANDEENLVAASKLQNQVKGASGTDKYLPPNSAYVPEYVDLWSAMLKKYPSLQMSEEESADFATLEAGVEQYRAMDEQYRNGEIDIKELNAFARETFKNDKHTAVYLQQQYDNSSPDAKIAAEQRSILFKWAQENKDVKYKGSSGMTASARPLDDPTFMESLDASFSSMNSIAQLMDLQKEWATQQHGRNGIDRAQLLKDVPAQYHADIIEAAEEYNDDAGLAVRDNILEDIANNAVFDNMPWYAQMGFAIPAVVADPMTLVPATGVAKATAHATRATRAWQTHGAFKGMATGSAWFAAGATETAVQAAPKLSADYTYTSSDYVLDTVAGGLLGAGMLAGVKGAGKIKQVWNKDGNTAKATELDDTVEVWDVDTLRIDDRPPLQAWEELRANEAKVDFSEEYEMTPAGKTKLEAIEKDAKRDYAKAMTSENGIVTKANKADGKARLTEIKEELDTISLDQGQADDVPIEYIRDLEKEGYLLDQMLKGNKEAEDVITKLREGIDIDETVRKVQEWENKGKTSGQKAAGKAAYEPVRAALRDANNFIMPKRPKADALSPREEEILRRKNIKKLKDDYADTIAAKNDKLQTELKSHILETDTTVNPPAGAYTSKAVTSDTSNTATLATEIHNGQQILVEVETQPEVGGLPNIDVAMDGELLTVSAGGKEVGLADIYEGVDTVSISPDLDAGKGYGQALYMRVSEMFPDKEIVAGIDQSKQAKKLWSRLEARGVTRRGEDGDMRILSHNVRTAPAEESVVPNTTAQINESITAAIDGFKQSGELEADQIARKANNPMQSVLRGLNKVGMTDLSTVLANSKSDAVKFVATRITEVGQGFGGKKARKVSAAVMRDSKFRSAQMEMIPTYRDTITEYAAAQGNGKLSEFRARNEAGVDNPLVEQFNREFITLQELRRQGADTAHIDPAIVKFADGWNKSMEVSFNHLIDAGVAGFSKLRKVDNYYTQSWLPTKLGMAEKKHGKDKIIDVLAKGYKTAAKQTEEMSDLDANKLARRIYDHIKTKKEQNQMDDEFISTAGQDARSKNRLNINTTAEIDGLSVMDLLDTDVVGVGTKYHNRMAGWSSLSEATDGVVNSDKAVQALLKQAGASGASKTELQYTSDVMEMMLGKPVRGGLSPVLREFKDLAALSQLGGKGMAQLAETGQVITRGVIRAFSDPKNLNKMLKDAGAKGDASDLSKEAQQLSFMSDDMEWMERQSTHVDTAESIGKVAVTANWMASKITGGNRLKANSGRLLGKISGFNMIRKTQSRITQAALVREIADQLLKGESKVGVARLKDIGLLDSHGKNNWLASVLRQHATVDTDGNILKMNIDKWPKKQADEMRYALLRDEAQQIQRTMIGELPGWMNSPMMSLLMQYREMPLVAMNKSLGKAAAFADREAVVGVMLSTMTAAIAMSGRQLVVSGSDAASGREFKDVDLDATNTAKYVNAAGMYPDLYDLVLNDGVAAAQDGSSKAWAGYALRQVPTLGLAKGYMDTVNSKDAKQLIDNTQTLLPLGNTMLGDAMFTFMMEKM